MTVKAMVAKSLSKIKPDHASKMTDAFNKALNKC